MFYIILLVYYICGLSFFVVTDIKYNNKLHSDPKTPDILMENLLNSNDQ